MKKILAGLVSMMLVLPVIPVGSAQAEEKVNLVSNGGFETVTWYQMPGEWDTTMSYLYTDFDGDYHYASTTAGSYTTSGVGLNGSKAYYAKSTSESESYGVNMKADSSYTPVTSGVNYQYTVGFDYKTPTGITSATSNMGVFTAANIFNSNRQYAMTGLSNALEATDGFVSYKKVLSRSSGISTSQVLVTDFGLRNAAVDNELYLDNVYATPVSIGTANTGSNGLLVLANAEWSQSIALDGTTDNYDFSGKIAGEDGVVVLQTYDAGDAKIGEAVTIPSASSSNETYAGVTGNIIVPKGATSLKITLKNVENSISTTYFDDIVVTEGEASAEDDSYQSRELIKNGGYESVAWYQMPEGWDTNISYLYTNFDDESHYASVNNTTYVKNSVGVNDSTGFYVKSASTSTAYTMNMKADSSYTPVTSGVNYQYTVGFDYKTPTGITSDTSNFGLFTGINIYNTNRQFAMTGASNALEATDGFVSYKKVLNRNSGISSSVTLATDFGLRNAAEDNELYLDNVYATPVSIGTANTGSNGLLVLANAEWTQSVSLDSLTRVYEFSGNIAGEDGVVGKW